MDTVEPVKYTDTARTYGTSNTSGTSSSASDSYEISDLEKELNYMMDMLFMNGAASSAIPSVQEAYQWLMNPNKNMSGKDFYEKLNQVKETFYNFMSGLSYNQIDRSNHSAVGKQDELGLVNKIKEKKSVLNPGNIYIYDEPEFSGANLGWGKAGTNVLSEMMKPEPDILSKIGVTLYNAYHAGLMGDDLTNKIINNAQLGGCLDKVLKMYQAGETDKKMFNYLELGVSADQRKQGDWCWAACMSTIDNFYNGGKGITQINLQAQVNPEDIKDTEFGVRDCEDFVNFILNKRVHEVPPYETIEANMRAGKPIVLHTRKPGEEKPKHFIVITGCYVKDGVQYVIINENRDGKQYSIRCDDLGKSFTTCDNAQQVYGYYTTRAK